MHKHILAGSVLALAAALAASSLSFAETTADDAVQARALIKQFTTTLQGELKAGLQQGGPVAAVEVCKKVAPGIAADLSEQSGWDVGRTSLKPRNKALNTPDAWERQVLEQFESRKAHGESPMGMSYASVEQTDDGKVYRYMQAIPTQEVCLACHGKDIAPDLAAALDKAYPDDQARGFELGDIRGAFTLSKPR
ncbi:MAG: DUF3365 domain-containing protein [Thiohalocapsa sp.]|uniref:Tll0287-like domain-containing protein n=1 Tax=Thiohalocapsa sp. TaxID=2497641 RepID=UPI0026006230|nr:DUF3365 domain-containing protein [Thiohalocapsa sp.]MCG6941999.1 DUF3365 domain-containing protein [Thiohalocapsa sp.]